MHGLNIRLPLAIITASLIVAISALLSAQVTRPGGIGSEDPCTGGQKTTTAFSTTARVVVISAAAGKKNHICSFGIVAAAAEIANVVEGTGTTCQTGSVALAGSTTAANGMSFAANGGMSSMAGIGTVIAGSGVNVDTCIVPSSTNRVAGFVTWVQK